MSVLIARELPRLAILSHAMICWSRNRDGRDGRYIYGQSRRFGHLESLHPHGRRVRLRRAGAPSPRGADWWRSSIVEEVALGALVPELLQVLRGRAQVVRRPRTLNFTIFLCFAWESLRQLLAQPTASCDKQLKLWKLELGLPHLGGRHYLSKRVGNVGVALWHSGRQQAGGTRSSDRSCARGSACHRAELVGRQPLSDPNWTIRFGGGNYTANPGNMESNVVGEG